jgi:hypothetical protein
MIPVVEKSSSQAVQKAPDARKAEEASACIMIPFD